MTDADRWTRIEALVDAAADLAPGARAAFLDRECRTPDGREDVALREEVEALLALDADAGRFFEAAADRLAAAAADASPGAVEPGAPERVGLWRLDGEIGRGGMGTVHRAERADGRFEQTAALKLVRSGLAPGLAARFRAERQILARLDHPAIARLIDGGQADDGRPFLVMELVRGEPITAYCDRRRLSVNERLALFESVCEAVQFAHGRLVVHRDLKPSNVLVTDEGRVKLLDFGIAKLLDAGDDGPQTTAGERLMTPEYAAPEQVRGEAITTATDVYALGVLLYELLAGRRPFGGSGRYAVERAVLEVEPERPSDAVTASAPTGGRVPPDPAGPDAIPGDTAARRATTADRLRRRLRGDLDRIVMKALHKAAERRYDGAAALASDVRRHLAGLPVEARPDSAAYRVRLFARRHRAAVALAALALVGVVGGAGAAIWQARQATAERDRATAEAKRAEGTAGFLVGLLSAASPFEARGDTLTVPEAISLSLASVDASLADEPLTRAAVFNAIATVLRDTGDYARADSLYGRATAALRDAGAAGADTTALAASVASGMGASLWFAGRLDAVEPFFRHALALQTRLGDPRGIAGATSDLALAMLETGRDAEALALLEQALVRYRAIGGPDDPDGLVVAGNLAVALVDARQMDRARTVADEVLASQRRLLGTAPHPDLSNALAAVGSVAAGQGRYAAAEAAYREAVAMRRALYGDDNDNTMGATGNLAHAILAQGRPAEALPLARRALAVYDDPEQPGRSVFFRMLVATATADAGDPEAAIPLLRRAVRDGEAHLTDSPNTDIARAALADVLARTGRDAEALRVARTVGGRIGDARARLWRERTQALRARARRPPAGAPAARNRAAP